MGKIVSTTHWCFHSYRVAKGFAGYDFTKTFGAEFGYADFGSFNYRVNPTYPGGGPTGDLYSFRYIAASLFADGKATMTVSGLFSVYGKLGLDLNRVQSTPFVHNINMPPIPPEVVVGNYASSSIFSSTQGGDTSYRLNRLIGAGAEMKASVRTSLRLEFEDYGEFGNQNNTGRARISTVSFDLIYRP